jgi:hypothetical protein
MTIDADLQAAFDYTFPLYEMARTRYLSVELPANPNRGVNRLMHRRELLDHTSRAVTTPNNDTLYSSAWLDLSQGPIEIKLSDFGGRYWSFQFMDAYTSTAEIVGSRNAGQGAVTLWAMLADDTRPVPAGVRAVRLPTRDVWMLGRILVDDAHDAKTVHAMQDAISLKAVDTAQVPWTNPPAPVATRGSPTDGGNYLAIVNAMLARNPVPLAADIVAAWLPLGVGPGSKVNIDMAAYWTATLPGLNATLKSGLGRGANMLAQWRFPQPEVGTFGSNYKLRAAVALGGLGALPPIEAMYLNTLHDTAGQRLDGSLRYRVHVDAAGVPARSFWSLSMYQIEPDGRLFFADNPAKRYTVGDRTPGLVKNADGSLDIILQHTAPDNAKDKANWLPAPKGPFHILLRAYLPTEALMQGQCELPTVERLP